MKSTPRIAKHQTLMELLKRETERTPVLRRILCLIKTPTAKAVQKHGSQPWKKDLKLSRSWLRPPMQRTELGLLRLPTLPKVHGRHFQWFLGLKQILGRRNNKPSGLMPSDVFHKATPSRLHHPLSPRSRSRSGEYPWSGDRKCLKI